MKICVQWLAQLRDAAGKAEETVEVPDDLTLADLLDRLACDAEGALGELLDGGSAGAGRRFLLVVNDATVGPGAAATHILQEGDCVALLPPISGG